MVLRLFRQVTSPKEARPLNRRFEDIAAEAARKKVELRDVAVVEAVKARVGDTMDGQVSSELDQGVLRLVPEDMVDESLEEGQVGPYIDEHTLLLIPAHLVRQYPFYLIAEGKDKLTLSELAKLSLSDRKMAIKMLGSELEIQNREQVEKILLNQRIPLPGGKGSLNDYLRHPHQTTLKEIR